VRFRQGAPIKGGGLHQRSENQPRQNYEAGRKHLASLARTRRNNVMGSRFPLAPSSCSHILATRIPRLRSCRFVVKSRRRFRSIFVLQNRTLVRGKWPQVRHPCQKQPSTKSATRDSAKKKSGFPKIFGGCTFQPFRPACAKSARRRRSVVRLPRERMDLIIPERITGTSLNLPDKSVFFRARSKMVTNASCKAFDQKKLRDGRSSASG
jgi:hypothetical protein